ncbi:MAG: AMP-binding protein, partial [bacterium]
MTDTPPIWTPSTEQVARARVTQFIRDAVKPLGGRAAAVVDTTSLYDWSIAEPAAFWPAVWRYCGVVAEERVGAAPWDDVLIGGDRMAPPDAALGPHWFTGARLNFAENLLRRRDDVEALVLWNETGRARSLTFAQLADAVARLAAFLRSAGVVTGDRVAGFVPNIPEAVVAMLATASLGAVWSSCSPDFGPAGVVDRFGQIAPTVLVVADGYRYGGKVIDSLERVRQFLPSLPSVERVVVIPNVETSGALEDVPGLEGAVSWREAMREHAPPP